MDVSVLIPTHNRAHTLGRALDSVLAQTLPAAEIIVVDDGSADGTADLLARRYPAVRCLRQSNHGVSHARNRAIEAAGGEWLALLDSDDAWLPGKLARQGAALHDDPGKRLCHSDEIWVRNGRRVNPGARHAKQGGDIFLQCLPRCVISPSAAVVHRDLLREAGGFDESLPACEDYDLWLRICAREPVAYVDEALVVKYGGHADQLSRRHWGMDRFRVQALEKLLRERPLGAGREAAVLATLVDKLQVLVKGAERRDNHELLAHCRPRLAHYRERLCALQAEA